jgi:hypothetical protein
MLMRNVTNRPLEANEVRKCTWEGLMCTTFDPPAGFVTLRTLLGCAVPGQDAVAHSGRRLT